MALDEIGKEAGNGAKVKSIDQFVAFIQTTAQNFNRFSADGAGDGSRTRDLKLGKLALYQLSYTRIAPPWVSVLPPVCQ